MGLTLIDFLFLFETLNDAQKGFLFKQVFTKFTISSILSIKTIFLRHFQLFFRVCCEFFDQKKLNFVN